MSYLSDRSQCVQADGTLSDVLPITSGIVQGSVLGPLPFSMFINDIVSQITSCRAHLYADDVQLYNSCEPKHIENCIRNLNMNFDRVHRWSIENCMAINPEKLQALLVNPSILLSPIVSPLLLGTNQVAKFCMRVFFTLKWLWTLAHFTPDDLNSVVVRYADC
jgi:hypothetical protein